MTRRGKTLKTFVDLGRLPSDPQPRSRRLESGALLLSRSIPQVYGVNLGVFVARGTRDENTAVGGISHLLEHMVFKGTHDRSAFELARDIEALGAHLDAYTTKEYTAYTLRVVPDVLDDAVPLMADMLLRSTFPQDQLELEQQVVIEEILSAEDNPDDFAHERFTDHLLAGHPLMHPILGTQESVVRISRDALVQHASEVHRGNNLVLALTGGVTEEHEEIVAKAFPFAAGGTGRQRSGQPAPASGSFVYAGDSAQQYVEIGSVGMDARHPDRFAAMVLCNLLGGGMSSRLFQKVREELGLAYSIYSYTELFEDVGTVCTSFSASPENCAKAMDVVVREYRRLAAGDVDDIEVEHNKTQLAASVVLGMEGASSAMNRLALGHMVHGRFVPVTEVLEALAAVTRDDIVRLAEAYLEPSRQTVVGYGPLKELEFPFG